MSQSRLHGKVALLTGAASGIGEATARLFAANGASVVIADIQDELGHEVVASIGTEKSCFRHCDVRDEKQVEEAINYAVERYGKLDILFSNAGICIGGPGTQILELDMDHFNDTMVINVNGVVATIKHAARVMVAQNIRGSIICMASVAASLGGLVPLAYTTSKHAVVGLVRSACAELGVYGIRVNAIAPYAVATPMTCNVFNLTTDQIEENFCSMGNLKDVVLKARHVADAALFLASDESEYISGHSLTVDGGFTAVKVVK